MCGGIFYYHFARNLPLRLSVTEFSKIGKNIVAPFSGHGVVNTYIKTPAGTDNVYG